MGALIRELPHTATTEHLLDVLEPGDHEVLLCLCGRVPLNAFPFYAAWHASKRLMRRVPFVVCGQDAAIQHEFCYLREEVQACIDYGLMPSGFLEIADGVVDLSTLRRREEAGLRFRGLYVGMATCLLSHGDLPRLALPLPLLFTPLFYTNVLTTPARPNHGMAPSFR
jgi:hypothetical protein